MSKNKVGAIKSVEPRFVKFNPAEYEGYEIVPQWSVDTEPTDSAPEPEQERSVAQWAGDTLLGATRSTLIVPKVLGTGYGLVTGNMDNYLLENADRADEILRNEYSDPLKKKIAARDKKIKEADGIVDTATTAFGETVGDAALALDTVASNLGSLVTMGGVGAAAKLAVAGRGLRAAQAVGPASQATLDAVGATAAKVGTRTALGAGATLQGADVAADVYKSALAKPDEAWAQNQKFMDAVAKTDGSDEAVKNLKHEFALDAARVAFPAAAGVSLATSKIAGGSAIENALVNGLGKTAGKGGFMAGVGAAAKTLTGETVSEGLEEGGGAIAGNVAKQQFVDTNQDLTENVGENTGMGAAGGFLMGGVPSAMQGYSAYKGDEQNQLPVIGAQTPATPEVPPANPLNAVQQAAQQPGSVLSRAAVAGNQNTVAATLDAPVAPNTAAVAPNIDAQTANPVTTPNAPVDEFTQAWNEDDAAKQQAEQDAAAKAAYEAGEWVDEAYAKDENTAYTYILAARNDTANEYQVERTNDGGFMLQKRKAQAANAPAQNLAPNEDVNGATTDIQPATGATGPAADNDSAGMGLGSAVQHGLATQQGASNPDSVANVASTTGASTADALDGWQYAAESDDRVEILKKQEAYSQADPENEYRFVPSGSGFELQFRPKAADASKEQLLQQVNQPTGESHGIETAQTFQTEAQGQETSTAEPVEQDDAPLTPEQIAKNDAIDAALDEVMPDLNQEQAPTEPVNEPHWKDANNLTALLPDSVGKPGKTGILRGHVRDLAKKVPDGTETAEALKKLADSLGMGRNNVPPIKFAAAENGTSPISATEGTKAPESQLVQDFIDGKTDTPPSVEDVKAELEAKEKQTTTVNVPQPVSDAFQNTLQKQKARITRLRDEVDKAGSLDEKLAAKNKEKAAEATLRALRMEIFNAEDAAIKAIESGDVGAFEKFADLFPDAIPAIQSLIPPKKIAPGTRINGKREKDAANRLEKLYEQMGNITKRDTPEGSAKGQVRSLIEELRKERTAVSVVPILEEASQRLARNYGAFSRVLDEVAESLSDTAQQDNTPSDRGMTLQEAPAKGLDEQLAEVKAELFSQGRVQNASTRAKLDAIRKQIAERDFPEILKAVDDNIDVAEELNRAFEFAGDEPKAKTIERILKKRGITPEYQARWTERLMDGQNDELDAEMQSYEENFDPSLPSSVRAKKKNTSPSILDVGVAAGRVKVVNVGDKPVKPEAKAEPKVEPQADPLDDKSTAAPAETPALEDGDDIANTAEKSNTETNVRNNGESNGYSSNDANDNQSLESQLQGASTEDGSSRNDETSGGLRQVDEGRDGLADSSGVGRENGLDRDKESLLPSTPADIRPLADGPLGRKEDRPQQLTGDNPGNFVIEDSFDLGSGTDGQKISGNLNAIRTLRLVQNEQRYPTTDEQAIMARYVGWGGLAKVFDSSKADATDQYGKAQRELKTLLSPEEYAAANASIRNAHYTAQGVVDGMWRVIRFMGFKGGRALEPTVGIGNFIGRMPQDMAGSTEWHASELDKITGQLAAMVYPEANILAGTGFQDAPFADGVFDLSIGNPPFGAITIADKSAKRKHLDGQKIHNYIIAKTGMHLRPGGVMAMVVTHRFLDTANPEARDVLAKDFRFLGAFRLPNDAFLANAGTEVTTDVLFLQKLNDNEARERDASWLDVNGVIVVDGQEMRVNRYFQENPAHILGRSAMDGTMYAGRRDSGQGEYTVHSDGRDLGEAIDALMQSGFKKMSNILAQTNESRDLAPVMLQQSDLSIGGIHLNEDGKIIRREMDDEYGNAVINEITPDTLWKDKAAEWMALRNAIVDVKNAASSGLVTSEDANEVLALSRFLFKSDGSKAETTKAAEAVYELVDALSRPRLFQWTYDEQLNQINAALNRKQLGEDNYEALKGMLDLRNRVLRLIAAEQTNHPEMDAYRSNLNAAYDAFVKKHGFISDPNNANLLGGDIGAESGLESSFEPAVSAAVSKSQGIPQRKASATKADILSRRVNYPYKEIDYAENSFDALFASLSEHGKIDLPYMARITGKPVLEVIEDLTTGENPMLFLDPETETYQDAEQYLSGNVKKKLKEAQNRRLQQNVKALEAVLPKDLTKESIKPNIRGMWMPKEIFVEFLSDIGYKNVNITILESQGIIKSDAAGLKPTDFGSQFSNEYKQPHELFNAAAAGKAITITNDDGKKLDEATKAVNALAERMGTIFQDWAYADEGRVTKIVEAYNDKMNTHVQRTYDGVKYLRPVGASPSITLRRTQLNGAWRMMQEKTMLADHVVGAGKTFTLITGIMERRRMGLSRKPMVAVPNHLVTQWARDFYLMYPGAKILAATPADFAKKNRRRLLSRIATGDYDAVIVGHTSLGFIESNADDLKAIITEKVDALKQAEEELKRNGEKKSTLKQIQDKIEKYKERLKDIADRKTDDIGIDFKSLGVDYLAVDEAHEFKNLEYATSGERVVGMNDPNGSKKAFDLYVKVRGLLGRNGGVAFATGTPVSNSLVEIFTMMSYLAHDELKLRDQEHFDSWSGAYAATNTALEYTATQTLKPRRVLSGLNNLDALRQLYTHFADIITMNDIKRIYTEDAIAKNEKLGTNDRTDFPVPKVANGGRQLNMGDITPAQQEYMDYLVARMKKIESKKGDKEYMRIDNALNVLTDARKMSLDIRIVDPNAPRDENGKVARATKNIKRVYDKWEADRGTQLVFCDLSTPAKTAQKEAGKLINATIEAIYPKDQVRQVKKRLEGKKFEQQWQALVRAADEITDDITTSEEKRDALANYFAKIEDAEATMNVADIGFSVYDDLKAALVESGIPPTEIAFIHDFDTPEKKQKLFSRVNEGYIRVLIGSSAKMGAGTNAQKRLVALHHMDAPWRPSDVEQREGRIIRQGNAFYGAINDFELKKLPPDILAAQARLKQQNPDGFEVEILAYSTNQTSDTVMWQILQRKAKAIEQFRNGGITSLEEESNDSDQYAEFMAASTGNPVFRQKLEAERKLLDLETQVSGALTTRAKISSFMNHYDSYKNRYENNDRLFEQMNLAEASYGGEKGTLNEYVAAINAAQNAYSDSLAAWEIAAEKAEADSKIWENAPPETRGKKPSFPIKPSRPNLLTPSVQEKSGYARAIGLALKEAKPDTQSRISFEDGSRIVIYAHDFVDSGGGKSRSWEIRLRKDDAIDMLLLKSNAINLMDSDAKYKLLPENLQSEVSSARQSNQRSLKYLNEQHDNYSKLNSEKVDTSERDQAREEVNWLTLQVAFAEHQAAKERSERKNRYIARDTRRDLTTSSEVTDDPVEKLVIDGVGYTTTGRYELSYDKFSEATRDSDGMPVIIIQSREDGVYTPTKVFLQPKNLRNEPDASSEIRFSRKAGQSDIRMSRGNFYYSALTKSVQGLQAKQMMAGAWAMQLQALVKKGAIKQAELEWSGLSDWLKLQEGKITKEQILGYLDNNGVQVEEVTLQTIVKPDSVFLGASPKYSQYQLPGGENYREVLLTLPVQKRWEGTRETDGKSEFFATFDEAKEYAGKWGAVTEAGEYGFDGGYKSKHWDQPNVLAHIRLNDRIDADGKRVLFVEELQSDWAQEGRKEGFKTGAREYRVSDMELDSSNDYAWVIKTADGAWQQRISKTDYEYRGGIQKALQDSAAAASRKAHEERGKIPVAPFVATTDGWLNLALKRIIKIAVDEGYEKVAFVSGEQSAERYDLSKQVNSIEWDDAVAMKGGIRVSINMPQGLQTLFVEKGDGSIFKGDGPIGDVSGKPLEEVVGKEIAKNILKNTSGEFKGADLKVGGEGMKAFYDKIVPNTVNALLKKVGGGKAENVSFDYAQKWVKENDETYTVDNGYFKVGQDVAGEWFVVSKYDIEINETFSTAEKAMNKADAYRIDVRHDRERGMNKQLGFTITPAMREAASNGLPLFSKGSQVTGMPQVKVREIVDVIRSTWKNSPDVVVASNINDPIIPQAVRDADRLQKSQGAVGNAEGFVYDGKVYVVASEMNAPQDVVRVLFHEALGHMGLRGVYGNSLKQVLNQVILGRRKEVIAKAISYGLDPSNNDDLLEAAEEVLAEMAQTRPELGFVQRAIAAIRNFLRTHVPMFKNMEFSDADIIQAFILPARRFVENGGGGGGGGLRYLRAFHGTPHNGIEKFSTEKIGTGEGAQAFGWGLYFASQKEVADYYRHMLSVSKKLRDAEFDSFGAPNRVAQVAFQIDSGIDDSSIRDGLQIVLESASDTELDTIMDQGRQLYVETKNSGQLYEVEIPEESEMLDWHKPLSEQDNTSDDWVRSKWRDIADGENLPHQYTKAKNFAGRTGEDLYKALSSKLGGDKAASKVLNSYGIKGIKYLDDQSRANGKGSHNYVIFDGADVAIEKTHFSRTPLANANFSVGAQRTFQNSIMNRLNDLRRSSAKVSLWDKSVGTQYHLSERNSEYKRTFDAVQRFISDTSIFANNAADLAPTMLPKLEKLKDFVKKALPVADVKAVSNAVFGGTLHWSRDAAGNLVEQEAVLEAAANMSVHDKAQALLRANKISPNVLRMWQGMQIDQYESLINSKYENDVIRPGVVFTPAELRDKFGMTDKQIGLYQEFRKATDKSLIDLALSEMVRMGGADLYPISDMIMEHGDVKKAADEIAEYLESMKQLKPNREADLSDSIDKVQALADRALDLMNRGYAPLMRFGKYAVYAKGANGEQLFFGMYESQREANWAETALRKHYPQAQISSGIMSQEQHKLFQGVSPETLALFGDAMGLDTDSEKAAIYQEFVKLVADSKSTMRRMLNRKGIPGYSEDATRVLAGFITSNSRKTASNLNSYELEKSVNEITAGDVKDAAIKLKEYVQNPEEEAQWVRGMLFTQYIGGSVASAIVNLTQSLTMTFPYLSQFTSVADAGARMADAALMTGKGIDKAIKEAIAKNQDAKVIQQLTDLKAALKRAEDDGVVAPQEIHQLMAHAQGKGGLKSGDGTTTGDALAAGSNALSKLALLWGNMFSAAEVFNRNAAFIAAYQLAKDKNAAYQLAFANDPNTKEKSLGDPFAFAEKTVKETQGIYNKGNKPAWARGWVGSVLFTFKQFSISYVEFLQRMYVNDGRNGQEGKKAMALALGVLMLTAGVAGLPGGDDLDDVIDAIAQATGRNFSLDQWKKEVAENIFGSPAAAQFVLYGLTGLPGSPIDISGRMGLGNLIPGTGFLLRKNDHTRDVQEMFGPISDLLSRSYNAGGELFRGNVVDAAKEISPVAARNVLQGVDMLKTGMYRDAKDNKVIETDTKDAIAKMVGFQPNDVAKVQKATFTTQRMVATARMVESEIVHEFALGRFERDQSKIDAARKRLQKWNEKNPSTPIRITVQQVNKKVQNMNKTKAQRMSAAAPKEVRAAVQRELAGF